jgi:hypothetical protein
MKLFYNRNLEEPHWNGNVNLKANGDLLVVQFVNKDGTDFAQTPSIALHLVTPQNPLSKFIEPVLDSSRYWVVLVQEPRTGAKMPFGFGFGPEQRDNAFSFNAAIIDQLNLVRRTRGYIEQELPANLPAAASSMAELLEDDADPDDGKATSTVSLSGLSGPITINMDKFLENRRSLRAGKVENEEQIKKKKKSKRKDKELADLEASFANVFFDTVAPASALSVPVSSSAATVPPVLVPPKSSESGSGLVFASI